MILDTFLNLSSIYLDKSISGIQMTGEQLVNRTTPMPVTTFQTDGLMGIIAGINEFLRAILGIFGGGGV